MTERDNVANADKPPSDIKTTKNPERAQRLSSALRENLKRRKAAPRPKKPNPDTA
ncbi:MAG: hypothetical protein MK052_12050 [Alphaproteobacteria bacterium]|nr:hypothetical protein [Alphaproteobacteria bacterium]